MWLKAATEQKWKAARSVCRWGPPYHLAKISLAVCTPFEATPQRDVRDHSFIYHGVSFRVTFNTAPPSVVWSYLTFLFRSCWISEWIRRLSARQVRPNPVDSAKHNTNPFASEGDLLRGQEKNILDNIAYGTNGEINSICNICVRTVVLVERHFT